MEIGWLADLGSTNLTLGVAYCFYRGCGMELLLNREVLIENIVGLEGLAIHLEDLVVGGCIGIDDRSAKLDEGRVFGLKLIGDIGILVARDLAPRRPMLFSIPELLGPFLLGILLFSLQGRAQQRGT